MSYYREIVFGLRAEPYIAVHRPQFHGRADVHDPLVVDGLRVELELGRARGSPATVDVYSDADEVELLLNGRSLDRTAVGAEKAFLARFEVAYEPGELVAVAYAGGEEQARTALRTADGPLRLDAARRPRRDPRRRHGPRLHRRSPWRTRPATSRPTATGSVTVAVAGPGVLAGLGSADPRTEEPFGASACTTFDGRALAIVRPTGAGEIEVRVEAEECEPVTVTVRALAP